MSADTLLQKTALFYLVPLLLGGCATYTPCDPDAALAVAGLQPPSNACRVDGCTLAPDLDFTVCCNAHDIHYWVGGSACERKIVDQNFRECIRDADHPILAEIYYYGVRLGGTPYLPTPWRWGFGWDYPLGYSANKLNKNDRRCPYGQKTHAACRW